MASYSITSHELSGACFYLVSGHGGPDPGAIGTYLDHKLHEDEYAYDIVLRLGRELLMRGAKVHFIIQDKKDGIRNEKILKNSKRETCMGKSIPLDQVARLKQRSQKIDQLYKKDKSNYIQPLDRRLVLALTIDEIFHSHTCCIQKGTENVLYILYGILLPYFKYRSLVKCHISIDIFQ